MPTKTGSDCDTISMAEKITFQFFGLKTDHKELKPTINPKTDHREHRHTINPKTDHREHRQR